ncbi:MAG: hemolysin family protein [Beijerinckiaceae bacterium]|nr:hemolysin family protein [Beijerinckiaceae bacterium]
MLELAIAAFLIALNGAFALSELAIVSSRKSRLKLMADDGRGGAAVALRLAEDPGRFLSTVQIGITMVGVLAGVFSGAALSDMLSDYLREQGFGPLASTAVGYTVVVGLITYFSVVVGELVPKHFALRNPERIACTIAPPMDLLSRVAAPIVWLLDSSTRFIFRFLGGDTGAETAVTEEEIKSLVAEAATAGVIESDERRMISAVLRLGDRPVRSIMTPRTDVAWIDLDDTHEEIVALLRACNHSLLPVGRGAIENVIGIIQVRELLAPALAGEKLDIEKLLHQAPIVPDTLDALDALQVLKGADIPMALVHDEYGHFDGVVTPADILDAIAGAFPTGEDEEEPAAFQREDGSWLIAGWMSADDMAEQLGVVLPERRDYETVAGLVINRLQHLPVTGEKVEAFGWRFEVVDLDGRRIDKVLASRIPEADDDTG